MGDEAEEVIDWQLPSQLVRCHMGAEEGLVGDRECLRDTGLLGWVRYCKVCHAAVCRRHSHTGVLADTDLIPMRTTFALSIYLYLSFRTHQLYHHCVLIPPPTDIATHSPCEHHLLNHACTVLPSHCPFPSLLRHHPVIPSL